MKEFCIHYQAAAFNKICKQGVEYSIFPSHEQTPCWDDRVKSCALAAYPTAEQIAERDARIAGLLEGMSKFMSHETDICFHCKKQVISLKQVGRCVYGSCGCRMWQGTIPKEWKSGAPSKKEKYT